MKKLIIIILVLFSQNLKAQIKSGPMLGYSDMREVLLWIQTEKTDKVKFAYWDIQNPAVKYFTEEIKSEKSKAYVVKLIADEVMPSKRYKYEVYVNKKLQKFDYPLEFQTQTLWQYRTDPPNFKFAVGSCVYINEEKFDRPGTPYGKSIGIFKHMIDTKPNFMVWGGDNNYLREPDFGTITGINHRHTDLKKVKELQPFWANVHHYAIWDDHDYGANDADRGNPVKEMALGAFKNFWGNQHYTFKDEAITGSFLWEDCQFFMMDNRWWKAPNDLEDKDKDYYGAKQLNWLIDALKTSSAPFKFVVTGGQVVNEAAVFENMATYPTERKMLLDKLMEQKIPGVIFISGDRHHTNLQKLEREGGYPLYDLTVSPLTSGSGKPVAEELKGNTIVPGTETYSINNFGLMEISGKRGERVLKINIIDAEGQKKWDYTINAKDLRFKK